MNCDKVRRYLPLYLDSELGTETSYEISRHLESCPACRARADAEGRMEEAFREALSKAPQGTSEAWDRAAHRALGRRDRRSWIAAAAGLLLILGAGAYLLGAGEIDLAAAMDHSHRKYLAGGLAPAIETSDPSALVAYFRGKLPVRTTLGLPPEDVSLLGGRCCYLDRSPCAYLMAHAGNAAVSIFIMDASQLAAFPEARPAVEEGALRCRVGPFHVLAYRDGDRIVCAIADLDPEKLEILARAISGSPLKGGNK